MRKPNIGKMWKIFAVARNHVGNYLYSCKLTFKYLCTGTDFVFVFLLCFAFFFFCSAVSLNFSVAVRLREFTSFFLFNCVVSRALAGRQLAYAKWHSTIPAGWLAGSLANDSLTKILCVWERSWGGNLLFIRVKIVVIPRVISMIDTFVGGHLRCHKSFLEISSCDWCSPIPWFMNFQQLIFDCWFGRRVSTSKSQLHGWWTVRRQSKFPIRSKLLEIIDRA